MFGDPPLSESDVARIVSERWVISCESLEYAPIGYGSYHWYANEDGRRRWLVTADRADRRPIAAAYELTHRLGERFMFVRSPVACSDGGVVVNLDGWLISVWPWLDGRGGSFGDEQSADEVAAVAECLRSLHDYRELPADPRLIDDWDIPGRAMLEKVLGQEISSASAGPYAADVSDRVVANRPRLVGMLAQFDDLAVRVRDAAELVITHGEPHVGNLVHTEDGVVMIDWDTVRWAPRERDLWWLPGEGWREAYGLDQPVSEEAIEMYRLRWTLFDVADFVPALMLAPEPTPDLDLAMEWVRKLLPL
ncbi:MAG: aminoglycoside phosphotransferase family protein [Acidimicrobiia bacterium]|nr:aminoglycoside phosphotransferase family protein [Acidimicrobiia bacterium]